MNCNAARNESTVGPHLIAGEPGGPGNDNGAPAKEDEVEGEDEVKDKDEDEVPVDEVKPDGEAGEAEIA